MAKRSYGQDCPVARALDVIGERWTLLIVRELLLGPKRFKDLLARLPAMGTTRLSDRLKALEGHGVVTKRTLPPPGDVQAYVLTPYGERLRPIVTMLGAWGAELPIPEDGDGLPARKETVALVLAGLSPPQLSEGLSESYEFHVDGEVFHALVDDGTVTVQSGPDLHRATATVTCDPRTFDALLRGRTTLERAVAGHRATASGDPAALDRVFTVLRFRVGDVTGQRYSDSRTRAANS
ncbi:MAG TPA: winged helix-turn-helix transcriptional regulator [Streptosporangiales bacterium]